MQESGLCPSPPLSKSHQTVLLVTHLGQDLGPTSMLQDSQVTVVMQEIYLSSQALVAALLEAELHPDSLTRAGYTAAVKLKDLECATTLITFVHLCRMGLPLLTSSLMCQNPDAPPPPSSRSHQTVQPNLLAEFVPAKLVMRAISTKVVTI